MDAGPGKIVPVQETQRITRSMTSGLSSSNIVGVKKATIRQKATASIAEEPKRRRGVAAGAVQRSQRTAQHPATHLKPSLRPTPPLSAPTFGLIQERIAGNLYFLVLQAMLWNQTTGKQARPVFERLVLEYPLPADLALASLPVLTAALQPIGLHNIRAARCIALGQRWCDEPPCEAKRYVRKGYPVQNFEDEVGDQGWEIAHLPGVGPYALDSFRIFYRDQLRGLATDWLGKGADEGFEPEWKRVLPADKKLRAYLKWMWMKEGWDWDERSGKRRRANGWKEGRYINEATGEEEEDTKGELV
ncbi:MAG: hypothetical protein LQ340_007260 [Diploschistes diacapsis]|nr:MAG: hypothetical protein LQ340_007260 [Diploschistes diacapsis]